MHLSGVRPSVCLSYRLRPAGLLVSTLSAAAIHSCGHRVQACQRAAANAGGVTLRADGGSTQTCFKSHPSISCLMFLCICLYVLLAFWAYAHCIYNQSKNRSSDRKDVK